MLKLEMTVLGVQLVVWFHILSNVISCTEPEVCRSEKMKIFLDSAASFLIKAQDLNNGDDGKHLPCPSKPMDCEDILVCGKKASGSYDVWPHSRISDKKVNVYCDMDTAGGGWTVFQRRGDYGRPRDYFYNDWNAYKTGFGRITEDFWLGNDNIYALTNQRLYSLRIDMKDLEKNTRYAAYDNFWIDPEEYKYTLHVRGFTGNAGDSFGPHAEKPFSTKDRDHDMHANSSCALSYKGGWWYGSCHSSNLNGLFLNGTHTSYANGIEWFTWKNMNYSLPFVEMKIRSFSFTPYNPKAVDPQ